MKYGRTGLAALASAMVLLAASPAFALFGVCVAQDSDSRTYVSRQPGVFEGQVRSLAETVAMTDCHARSQHPGSCKIVSCTVTN